MAKLNQSEYGKLLAHSLPHVIHSDDELDFYTRQLEELSDVANPTAEQEELMELLTLLITSYEERTYPIPKSSPTEILKFLMEQHNLKQVDLVEIFGSKSVVSEVLNGKRPFSKAHIQRVSERFHVSPELFLEPVPA